MKIRAYSGEMYASRTEFRSVERRYDNDELIHQIAYSARDFVRDTYNITITEDGGAESAEPCSAARFRPMDVNNKDARYPRPCEHSLTHAVKSSVTKVIATIITLVLASVFHACCK